MGDLRDPGVLDVGSSEVSRTPKQDMGAREREEVLDPRQVKLDRRADGASGKRLGRAGVEPRLPEENASLGWCGGEDRGGS